MSPEEWGAWIKEVLVGVDWLVPAFQTKTFIEALARTIEQCQGNDKIIALKIIMSALYSPNYLATMHLERYTKIPHFSNFTSQIDECFRAFFCGYKRVAITAMIPVIEGIIRKLSESFGRDIGTGTAQIKKEFKLLVELEHTASHKHEERVVMLEILSDFISQRFLEKTSQYTGLQELNRHGILHGLFHDFDDELNFLRLITILDLLCFLLIYQAKVDLSLFAPSQTEASQVLGSAYKKLQPPDKHYPQPDEIRIMRLFMQIVDDR